MLCRAPLPLPLASVNEEAKGPVMARWRLGWGGGSGEALVLQIVLEGWLCPGPHQLLWVDSRLSDILTVVAALRPG